MGELRNETKHYGSSIFLFRHLSRIMFQRDVQKQALPYLSLPFTNNASSAHNSNLSWFVSASPNTFLLSNSTCIQ